MRVLMRETRTQSDVTGDRLLLGGEVYEVADAIAWQWIRAGRAMEVTEDPVAVKMLAGAPENKTRGRKAC